MSSPRLHSILLEFLVVANGVIPRTTGHLAHAVFFSLLKEIAADLNVQLHNGPSPRPFTLSSLVGGKIQEDQLFLQQNTSCSIRLTLLDGGLLWSRLMTYFLESRPIIQLFGGTELCLTRMITTPSPQTLNQVCFTDWHTLVASSPQPLVTFHFRSPTAFSLGKRQFELFPQPTLIWKSLLDAWNSFAPENLHFDKRRIHQALLNQGVVLTLCDVRTHILRFPKYLQKGFTGTCTYRIQGEGVLVSELTALAAFAFYAGIGYKTTMGMGQVQIEFHEKTQLEPSLFPERGQKR